MRLYSRVFAIEFLPRVVSDLRLRLPVSRTATHQAVSTPGGCYLNFYPSKFAGTALKTCLMMHYVCAAGWDFKQKIHVRDETIKHLQRALDLLNQEKQRFKTACIDIENGLQE